jgi:hypothetical protein
MPPNDSRSWLILIHQLPPKPNALRVKIWRRLQQVGAIAIKQSVYALPLSEHSREDLSWILKEIIEGGGEGSISEVRFLEGLTDEQLIASFQGARQSDYEKLIQEVRQLLTAWASGQDDPQDPTLKGPAQVSRLRRRLDEITAIDFFRTPERGTAETLLQELAAKGSSEPTMASVGFLKEVGLLRGKTWVTRRNLFVDRIACGWLIRRFIDPGATFRFIPGTPYKPNPEELCFDLFDGNFTHEGDRCTFEVMIRRLGFQDSALIALSEIVHDIDLKDGRYGRPETEGFRALLTGVVTSILDDNRRLEEGSRLFENLYSYFQRPRTEHTLKDH